jgi:hypothetical protein
VVKSRWAAWTPPNTDDETKVSNTLPILVSPQVLSGVRVAHLGFTTSFWWDSCCSPWFHHQCLVGSALLILVSPPVFGGIYVAHLGFIKMSNTDPTKHWW